MGLRLLSSRYLYDDELGQRFPSNQRILRVIFSLA
jgi:hypothetical protein